MLCSSAQSTTGMPKRRSLIYTTVGDGYPYSGYKDAEVLLITHTRTIRRSQGAEPPAERERDRYVEKR